MRNIKDVRQRILNLCSFSLQPLSFSFAVFQNPFSVEKVDTSCHFPSLGEAAQVRLGSDSVLCHESKNWFFLPHIITDPYIQSVSAVKFFCSLSAHNILCHLYESCLPYPARDREQSVLTTSQPQRHDRCCQLTGCSQIGSSQTAGKDTLGDSTP